MSTFYATFSNWKQARSTTEELVNGGVSPDDLSLLFGGHKKDADGPIKEFVGSVGDATAYVGRSDDPSRREFPAAHEDINLFTSVGASRISPVDTSDISSDVESVDQMDDSQNETEFMITPHDGISNSAHEKDDLALTVLTGMPTAASNFSEEPFNPFEQGTQFSEGLEMIEIPNVGLIVGGGALATAALDFAGDKSECAAASLIDQLTEEGVPEDVARTYQKLFSEGQAILAVAVTPGELDENAVEEIATRHGAQNSELYDAPRY
jgi:hypothetical protein